MTRSIKLSVESSAQSIVGTERLFSKMTIEVVEATGMTDKIFVIRREPDTSGQPRDVHQYVAVPRDLEVISDEVPDVSGLYRSATTTVHWDRPVEYGKILLEIEERAQLLLDALAALDEIEAVQEIEIQA